MGGLFDKPAPPAPHRAITAHDEAILVSMRKVTGDMAYEAFSAER
jgi:hypothetical protein